MTITVAASGKRAFELVANDLNNDPCLFPRVPANSVFTQAFGFTTKIVATSDEDYLAFPYVTMIGTTLIGIYSKSDSHASGSSQVMIKSTDNGLTWSSVLFYDNDTGNYNYSLLNGVLASGDKVVLKVWTVTNTAGTFSVVINSPVSYGGLNYAMWSRPIAGPGGVLWRTGYAVNGSYTQTALFESSDDGDTWTGVSVIFDGSYLFSEADVVNVGGTNWLSVCRENTAPTVTGGNPLYYATSDDDGLTWVVQGQYNTSLVNGRQPNLTKLAAGDIILGAGVRSGTSGYAGSIGDQVRMVLTTGNCVYKKPKNTYANNPFHTYTSTPTTVRVTLNDHGFVAGDFISISGAVGFDGIPTSELNGILEVDSVLSNDWFTIIVTTPATTGNIDGGGASVIGYNLTQWGYRTQLEPMNSTDGGQPFANEISANRINVVYYTRKSVDTEPVISSASLNTENL